MFEFGMLVGYFMIWFVCVVGFEGCVVMLELEEDNVRVVCENFDCVGVFF